MISENDSSPRRQHDPWNKGRLIGQKRPLKPRDVWTIRVRLQLEGRKRHLALFNLAIDSKLRGCDLVRLQTDDVCVGGRVRDRATVIQKKTGRPVQFEITEQTRAAVQDWLSSLGARSGRYLFPSRFRKRSHISTRQYARIVHGWVASAGLDSSAYGTHSMRRTKPAQIYKKTGNLRAVQLLLGHTKLESTVRYLGIEVRTRSASQSRRSCEPIRSCGLAGPAGPQPVKNLSRAKWLNRPTGVRVDACLWLLAPWVKRGTPFRIRPPSTSAPVRFRLGRPSRRGHSRKSCRDCASEICIKKAQFYQGRGDDE